MNRHLFRQQFLVGTAVLAAAGAFAMAAVRAADQRAVCGPSSLTQGERYSPWSPGSLDLHHISTVRGNAMLAIYPEATIMMVDAGAIYEPLRCAIAPKPDASRRPGEWIARYAARHIATAVAQARLSVEDYRRYVRHRESHGEAVERFVAGSFRQLALVHAPDRFPDFNARVLAQLKSLNGHVVVRVPPGGDSFCVEILDNAEESDRLLACHGPYPSI